MFVLDIYNEKSEDLSTIHLSQFLFWPYAIIPPCNYICQIYLLKKEREREREKKGNYCLLFVSSVQCENYQDISDTSPYILFFEVVVFVTYCLLLKELYGHN